MAIGLLLLVSGLTAGPLSPVAPFLGGLGAAAVLCGLLLQRGRYGAAALVRLGTAFSLVVWVGFSIFFLSRQPWGLTVAMLKFRTASALAYLAVFVLFLAAGCGVLISLSGLPTMDGATKMGRSSLLWPALAGLLLTGVLCSRVVLAPQTGPFAEQAIAEARSQTGEGYSYHIVELARKSANPGILAVGRVQAWNDRELQELKVSWDY